MVRAVLKRLAEVVALDRAHVFHSWSAQAALTPMLIAGGEGSYVWDYEGTRYLDFSSQLVNTNIGHQHPKVIAAIQAQAAKLATVAPQHANDVRGEAAASAIPKIEAAVKSVPRLEALSSTSANSLSLVIAQFEYGTNIKDTRAAIEAAIGAATLPVGVAPRVSAVNINDQPVIIAAIGPAPGADPAAAALIARTELLPMLKAIPCTLMRGGTSKAALIAMTR